MLDFHSPKVAAEPVNDRLVVFTVEPLERGFGYTFGNTLRRVLLSSLEGAAVSAIKVTGVAHEFSSVPGVKEDVSDIILNLKKLIFVLHGEDEEINVELLKDGPGAATAGDIDAPSNLVIINPEAHVASLEDGARLEMSLRIKRGVGYVSADENKPAETVIGWIPIDSIFSPVKRVAYKVEAARVGQRTDYDKLTLEVETNGAVTPEQCVSQAAKLLVDMLSIFGLSEAAGGSWEDASLEHLSLSDAARSVAESAGAGSVRSLDALSDEELLAQPGADAALVDEIRGALNHVKSAGVTPPGLTEGGGQGAQAGLSKGPYDEMLIEELELSVRSYNCLKREGVETVGDLIAKTEAELLNTPNFGKKSIDEVREKLQRLGLKLRGE